MADIRSKQDEAGILKESGIPSSLAKKLKAYTLEHKAIITILGTNLTFNRPTLCHSQIESAPYPRHFQPKISNIDNGIFNGYAPVSPLYQPVKLHPGTNTWITSKIKTKDFPRHEKGKDLEIQAIPHAVPLRAFIESICDPTQQEDCDELYKIYELLPQNEQRKGNIHFRVRLNAKGVDAKLLGKEFHLLLTPSQYHGQYDDDFKNAPSWWQNIWGDYKNLTGKFYPLLDEKHEAIEVYGLIREELNPDYNSARIIRHLPIIKKINILLLAYDVHNDFLFKAINKHCPNAFNSYEFFNLSQGLVFLRELKKIHRTVIEQGKVSGAEDINSQVVKFLDNLRKETPLDDWFYATTPIDAYHLHLINEKLIAPKSTSKIHSEQDVIIAFVDGKMLRLEGAKALAELLINHPSYKTQINKHWYDAFDNIIKKTADKPLHDEALLQSRLITALTTSNLDLANIIDTEESAHNALVTHKIDTTKLFKKIKRFIKLISTYMKKHSINYARELNAITLNAYKTHFREHVINAFIYLNIFNEILNESLNKEATQLCIKNMLADIDTLSECVNVFLNSPYTQTMKGTHVCQTILAELDKLKTDIELLQD